MFNGVFDFLILPRFIIAMQNLSSQIVGEGLGVGHCGELVAGGHRKYK